MTKVEPIVGMGATLCHPQDRTPFRIVEVKKSKIGVIRVPDDGIKPAGECNGFPVFDHRFTPEEMEARCAGEQPAPQWAYRCKNGQYQLGGTPLAIGQAHYFRNYAE